MSDKTKHDDGAFACASGNGYQAGCTKREYFASMAMQGLLTRVPKRLDGQADLGILESKRIAEESVIMADELIKALNEGGQDNE